MPRTQGTMTTAEKISAIEESGLHLAWDQCHKIYVVRDVPQAAEMSSMNYDIRPAAEIKDILNRSCSLVFVSESTLSHGPWDIEQFDEDLWRAMGWPLDDR